MEIVGRVVKFEVSPQCAFRVAIPSLLRPVGMFSFGTAGLRFGNMNCGCFQAIPICALFDVGSLRVGSRIEGGEVLNRELPNPCRSPERGR